jgi:hypothetical protein
MKALHFWNWRWWCALIFAIRDKLEYPVCPWRFCLSSHLWVQQKKHNHVKELKVVETYPDGLPKTLLGIPVIRVNEKGEPIDE